MNNMNASKQWTVATIVIAVLMLIAAWFLLISPVMASAAETNAAAEAQENTNSETQIEVDKLRKQFAEIETYEAQLAELQEGITTRQRYSDLQRLFAEVASDHDVIITSLTFGSAETLEVKEPEGDSTEEDANVETTAPTESEPEPEPSASPGADGTGEVVEAEKSEIQGLYSIELGMSITGRYNNVLAAVDALQTGTNRIVLITSVNLGAVDTDALGESELAAAAEDLVTAQMAGETFVLLPGGPQADAPEGELPEEEVPLPQSTDNPLTPPVR